ncbi:MAG TPA: hypothetical protein VHX62_07240 [Solirubrobacteraceae bacterium]|nr:hypothetical protein [Solirubrobacteraceae bacterium]
MEPERQPPRRRRRARAAAGPPLTERDLAALAFAAEHRFVTAAHIAVLLGVTEPVADDRLRTLSEGGYLRRERKLHGEPASHRITGPGLRAAGSDLPTPRTLDLAHYRHDDGLVWLMLAARRGRFGSLREIAGERHIRSRDGREGDPETRYGVRLGGVGAGGRERLHYPDLILTTAGGDRVAFELELTGKPAERRARILAAYGADRRIDAVVYLVDRPAIGDAIARSARRLGIEDMVHVQRVRLDRGGGRGDGGRSLEPAHGRRGPELER